MTKKKQIIAAALALASCHARATADEPVKRTSPVKYQPQRKTGHAVVIDLRDPQWSQVSGATLTDPKWTEDLIYVQRRVTK